MGSRLSVNKLVLLLLRLIDNLITGVRIVIFLQSTWLHDQSKDEDDVSWNRETCFEPE